MRRVYKLLLLVCVVIILISVPATVAASTLPEFKIQAYNYVSVYANLSITDGKAKASATITGKTGITDKTSMQLFLQKYANQKWVTVDSWSAIGNTTTKSLSKTKAVTKGYKYRAKVVCVAYAGNNKESVTKYSRVVSY